MVDRPQICIIGNLIGKNGGKVTTQGHILAELFAADEFCVFSASSFQSRLFRLVHIVLVIVINRRRIDVTLVEVYSRLAFIIADVAGFVCRLLGLPVVMVLHGGQLPAFADRFPKWTARVLGRASGLVAPSQYLADEFVARGFNVQIIPNVVEIGSYPYRERTRPSPSLLWMRSFHPIYNPHLALEVFCGLYRRYPAAKMMMAGVDKGLLADVKSKAAEMGLSGAVTFPGFLDPDRKKEALDSADIFINTNRVDNMPVAVIEARASGLPVVATSVGGVPHLITHEADGMLVDDGDAEGMLRAIVRLVEDPDLAARLSRRGREYAERCSWEVVRPQWLRLFEYLSNEPVAEPVLAEK